MDFSDITATDLEDGILGPKFFKEYREQVTERMKDDKYMNLLAIYVNSIFQVFESFLRREVDLVEDGVKLSLDENNSSFITYELTPCIYTFKDLSEALFKILQSEYPGPRNVFVNKFDVITIKTKLIVRDGTIAIRFDEKSFFF